MNPLMSSISRIETKLDDIKENQDTLMRDFKEHQLNDWAHGLGVIKWVVGLTAGVIISIVGVYLELR